MDPSSIHDYSREAAVRTSHDGTHDTAGAADQSVSELRQAYESLLRQNRELSVIAEICRGMTTTVDLDRALRGSLGRIGPILEAKFGAILLWADALDCLQLHAVYSEQNPDDMESQEAQQSNQQLRTFRDNPIKACYDRREVLTYLDAQVCDDAALRQMAIKAGFRGTIFLPLVAHEQVFGVAVLNFQDRHDFPADDLRLMQVFADQLALKIHESLQARELNTQRNFLEHVTALVPVTIALLDRDLIFRWMNPATAELLARQTGDAGKFLGRGFYEVFPEAPNPHPRLHAAIQEKRVIAGEAIEIPFFEAGERVSTCWDMIFAPLIGEGGLVDGVFMIGLDVTERVLRERDQHEHIVRLEKFDRLKDEFLNTASHELRTPLTSIMGYSEFLQDGLAGTLTELQHEYVFEIQEGATRLERIVSDLLDFARLEAGAFLLVRREADLGAVVEGAIASLRPQTRSAGVEVQLDLQALRVTTMFDPQRVIQVILNLVGNAIKFTPSGGRVRVEVKSSATHAHVAVEDTGGGIEPEELPKVFQKFFQGKRAPNWGHLGAGLGLFISRAIIEAHGGAIGVDSQEGQGSTFWFTLPLESDI